MSFEDILKGEGFVGFMPHPLEIKERPELDVFPLNVLFAQRVTQNGKNAMGSALYEPDIESFKQEEEKCSMEYHNIYGGKSRLVIEYDMLRKSYYGEKVVNGESAGMAEGPKWDMFFFHFTILGLAIGEMCEFEDIG